MAKVFRVKEKNKVKIGVVCDNCSKTSYYPLDKFKLAYKNNGFVICKHCGYTIRISESDLKGIVRV